MADEVCRLAVLLSPKAKKNSIEGMQGEELKIKIAAPPVDGAANQALVKYLSSILKHPSASFSVVAGQRGRRKLVKIEGISKNELWKRLKPLLSS